MKHWNRFICTISLAASFCCVMSLFGGAVFSATTAPVVTSLPVIKEGAVTPTKIAEDNLGNIYVTDPHAEGIMKYNSVGKLLQKIATAKEPGGIAFAKNGDLLVTQGTYVVALNPANGAEKARFGSFKSAFSIAVDNSPAGTGNIFVSDIQNYCVQVFNGVYADVDVSAGTGHNPYRATDSVYRANFIGDNQLKYFKGAGFFNRPAGVAIEKVSGNLAVVDSLNGSVQFFDQAGNYLITIGQFGYDPGHLFIMLTYPQSIAFEYTAAGALDRAYILDTNQSYVMVLDATAPLLTTTSWAWLADIGLYGHHNGDLIVPSDILIDKTNAANNRLLVSNGFGSLSVFGLSSLQPYNVAIDSITNNSMRVTWTNADSLFPYNAVRVYRSQVAEVIGTQVGGDLPAGTTSLPVSGLNQYTTYYYTVRAIYGASLATNSVTTNTDQVSAKTSGLFNLTVNINGSGQVNGGAACTSGACVSAQTSDAVVTLTAAPTGQSVFSGWFGDCFTTSETCIVAMDAAKSVTALFTAMPAFRVDGAYFDNLQQAYDAATDGATIKVLAGTWPSTNSTTEYNTAWQAKSVTIEGGYEATFTSNTGGTSTVVGRTYLNAGKVVMKQLKIK